jgi:acyl carrier protein
MTLSEFITEFEHTTSQPPGSIKGDEELMSLQGWDSLAVVDLMSMADARLGIELSPADLGACVRVNDLAILCGLKP